MTHGPLVRLLANILINGNEGVFQFKAEPSPPKLRLSSSSTSTPTPTLSSSNENFKLELGLGESSQETNQTHSSEEEPMEADRISSSSSSELETQEKLRVLEGLHFQRNPDVSDLSQRLILTSILNSLDATENDYAALFALCLLHAIHDNAGTVTVTFSFPTFLALPVLISNPPLQTRHGFLLGIDGELVGRFFYSGSLQLAETGGVGMAEPQPRTGDSTYNLHLVDRLISIITVSVKYGEAE